MMGENICCEKEYAFRSRDCDCHPSHVTKKELIQPPDISICHPNPIFRSLFPMIHSLFLVFPKIVRAFNWREQPTDSR